MSLLSSPSLHTVEDSAKAKRDKRDASERKASTWILVETPPSPSPVRDFTPFLKPSGHAVDTTTGEIRRFPDSQSYAAFVTRMKRQLKKIITRTMHRGRMVYRVREAERSFDVITDMVGGPALSDWALDRFKSGHDVSAILATIRLRLTQAVREILAGDRIVFAVSSHVGSSLLHFDFLCTRTGPDHQRIGRRGLRRAGPWCVAVDRHLRYGATISPEKADRLRRSIANFRRRYPDTVPSDILIARAGDRIAREVIGPELDAYIAAYARSVPDLERGHEAAAAAKRAAAQRAVERGDMTPAM